MICIANCKKLYNYVRGGIRLPTSITFSTLRASYSPILRIVNLYKHKYFNEYGQQTVAAFEHEGYATYNCYIMYRNVFCDLIKPFILVNFIWTAQGV